MNARGLLAAFVLSAALAACGDAAAPKFLGSDVSGGSFGRDFKLNDASGAPRSLADFRGKVVVMFFGYTQCPDACPTTLSELAAVMQKLGPDAARVQVLLGVTSIPSASPESYSRNTCRHSTRRSSDCAETRRQTAEVAKEFKVIYQKQPGATPGSYSMDHSAGSFIFDPQGRLRVYVSYGQPEQVFAHDIAELLRAKT